MPPSLIYPKGDPGAFCPRLTCPCRANLDPGKLTGGSSQCSHARTGVSAKDATGAAGGEVLRETPNFPVRLGPFAQVTDRRKRSERLQSMPRHHAAIAADASTRAASIAATVRRPRRAGRAAAGGAQLDVSAAATGSLEGAGAGKRNAAGFARRDAAAWVIDAVAGPAAGLSGGRQATAVLGADRASWLPRRRVEHSPAEQAVAEAVAFADEIARMEGNDRVDLGLEHFASEARYAGPE